jgi:hypothetical protein
MKDSTKWTQTFFKQPKFLGTLKMRGYINDHSTPFNALLWGECKEDDTKSVKYDKWQNETDWQTFLGTSDGSTIEFL